MTFKNQLAEEIRAKGPITVAEYMARCARYYYANRSPFGTDGDFITAPEISQIFGELVGAWLAHMWQQMGAPLFALCELGPGRGTLMSDVLRATAHIEGFHEAMRVSLVEASPALTALQKKTLADMHPRIAWSESLEHLPSLPLLLVANEFFDALPVHQYVKSYIKKKERSVACDKGRLYFTPPGAVTREESPESLAVMKTIAGHIKAYGGTALVIDYGYTQGTGDTLQAVRAHNPIDPLLAPGESDITAHVDFGALMRLAQKTGVKAHCTEQGAFLKRLGAELRAAALCRKADTEQQKTILSGLERLVAPHAMGTLFKVMAVTSLVDKPNGF